MARESGYESSRAACPFYRGSSPKGHYIRCEGIGGAVTVKLNYSGEERQRAEQLAAFCQDCYAECPVYRAIYTSKGYGT
jgi:hypothetical protein